MRKAKINRVTKETKIEIKLNLDGNGKSKIDTTIPFIDHMLTLFSRHGYFDLDILARGDTKIDDHHLVEDIGIVLGNALKNALGDKQKIVRYGHATIPMDESLSSVAIDISGRTYLVYNVKFLKGFDKQKQFQFDYQLVEEFFRAFVNKAEIVLHINMVYGKNNHHIAESIFKAVGRALKVAVSLNPQEKGVPSTKGKL